MLNQLINSVPFNTWVPFAPWTVTDTIIFNWYGLQNSSIITNFKNDQNFPTIELQTRQNPIIDGGWVMNRRYSAKEINLQWTLVASSETALNTLIDTFKRNLSEVEWYLDIQINWVYRRTKATCIKNDIFKRNSFDITRCKFDVTFKTLEPFSYLKATQSYLEEWISWDVNIDRDYDGTATTYPTFYIVFWPSVSWTTALSIEANDKKISIAETFWPADILIIDCANKTVTLNWADIDYTGTFPFLQYGSNSLDIKINWTFTCDLSILYSENYL